MVVQFRTGVVRLLNYLINIFKNTTLKIQNECTNLYKEIDE